jgi:rubrerythrin
MKTLKDLLNIAIEQEVGAQKLYARGAEIADNEKTRQFLRRLEKEEIEHEKMLFNIRETGIYDLTLPIGDESVFEVAKNSHGGNSLEPNKNWKIKDIWEIALQREYLAQQRYLKAAAASKDEELVTLFNNLARDEENHHRVVEQQFKMQTGQMKEEF